MGTGWHLRPLSRVMSSLLPHLPAGLTIAATALVLLARVVRVPSLDGVLCGIGPMKANVAFCLLLAGVSLALVRRAGTSRASALIGEALGLVTAIIGTLTLAELHNVTDWGIDTILYFRWLACDGVPAPQAVTALALVLFGLALALRHDGRAQRVSVVLVAGTALLTSISVLGLFYGSVEGTTGRFAEMAPMTAAAFSLLCAGYVAAYPELRQTTPLFGSSPESKTLQELLLATFLLPAIGGWVLIAGIRVGLYDAAFGAALLITLGFTVFTALILRDARDLSRARRAREEAEVRFRDLIEFLPEGVLTVDRDGLIRMVNRQVEELFDYSRAELIGRSIETVIPARFRTRHPVDRAGFMRQGQARLMGERDDLCCALTKNGREFPVEVSLSTLQGHGEEVVIAAVRDVTERHNAKRALEAIEQRYRDVVRNIDEIVYVVEMTGDSIAGRVVFVSDRVELTTGHTPQEFLENPQLWSSLIHPDDRSSVTALTNQMFRERTAITRRYRLHRQDTNEYRWLDDRLVPQFEPDGVHVTLFGVARDITEAVQAQEALKQSEERYREIFANDLTGAYVATPSGRLIACNSAFASMFGFTSVVDALRMDCASVYGSPADQKAFLDELRSKRRIVNREATYRRPDGERLHVIENAVGVFGQRGDLTEVRGYLVDTTHRKRLEEQLLHAQKMESIGRMVGGIAHDFNNLLTPIVSYAELLRSSVAKESPAQDDIEEIRHAAEQAAVMTRQLLAFGRRQVLRPRSLDMNTIVISMKKLIATTLGEGISVHYTLRPGLSRSMVDPSQVEQVLMNLVTNARDAMPEGGTLSLETANANLDADYARDHADLKPGSYVLLAVSDTCSGMDDETRAQVFEPFFTTKKEMGTGLGLASVYGIVRQSRGHIGVYSEPGKGATFRLYFPTTSEEGPAVQTDVSTGTRRTAGTETVLVVEDNPAICKLVARVLGAAGYQVLSASTPREALEISRDYRGRIYLLISDVILPDMNGRELSQKLLASRPELKVLFVSGFTQNAIVQQGVLAEGVDLLEKPFTPAALLERVRESLDRSDKIQ